MKLQQECVGCILGQADRVASKIDANTRLTQKIAQIALEHSKAFSFNQTPPEVATPLYEALAKAAQKKDLYDQAKAIASQEALALVPKLKEMIEHSSDTLLAAGKMAVAGNVIDLATQHEYDLEKDIQSVLDATFGVDHFSSLFEDLKTAQTVLYLADNAGEHIFDALFMEKLKTVYPNIHIYYATREHAIINDVTFEEAKESGLDTYATLLRSGCKTPGFVYANASIKAQELFGNSDVVIAKGMGNFETMTEISMRKVYHLFKVKCNVVSHYVGHPVGTYMALMRS